MFLFAVTEKTTIKTFPSLIVIFILHVYLFLPACMSIDPKCAWPYKGQKRMSDPWSGLNSEVTVVGHCMGSGN